MSCKGAAFGFATLNGLSVRRHLFCRSSANLRVCGKLFTGSQYPRAPRYFLVHTDKSAGNTPSTRGWEEYAGNFIFRPPHVIVRPSQRTAYGTGNGTPLPPKALVHFLGGAFVGAAPQVAYRWFLEQLALEGFVVVATPYRLSFDHLWTMDDVLTRFSAAAGMLALDYGPIPVVGIGHSLGALLHTLGGSLFCNADGYKAANVLIAFNNRRAEDAIPLFREFIAPVVKTVAQTGELSDVIERLVIDGPATFDTLFDTVTDVVFPGSRDSELFALVRQSRALAQQIPPLFAEVADGAFAFNPDPIEVMEAIRTLYKVRQTLIVSFENDILDDSRSLQKALDPERGGTVIRHGGTHLTHCAQDFLTHGSE